MIKQIHGPDHRSEVTPINPKVPDKKRKDFDPHTVSLLTLNDRSRAVCICNTYGKPIKAYTMPFTQVAFNGVDTLFFTDYPSNAASASGSTLVIKQCKNRNGSYLDVKLQIEGRCIDCSVIDDAGYMRIGKYILPVDYNGAQYTTNYKEYDTSDALASDLEDGSDVDEIDMITHLWEVSRERVYKDGVATKTIVKHILIDYIDTEHASLGRLYNKIKEIYGKNAEEVVGGSDQTHQVKVEEDTISKKHVKVEEDSGSKPRDSRYL